MLTKEFLFETLGWMGALFFIVAYLNLVRSKWTSNSFNYHIFNLLGGILLVFNTVYYHAWAAVFINGSWGLIAVYGLLKRKV